MRGKRVILAIVLGAVLGGGGYLIWRITHPPVSDRELITRLFDHIAQGVAKKSPRMIMETIARDYHDQFGYNKQSLHRLSLNLLRAEGTPRLIVDELRINVHQRQAEAALIGEVRVGGPGEEQRVYRGTTWFHLLKRHGDWLITSAGGWQPRVPDES